MRQAIREILKRHGQNVTIHFAEGDAEDKAFLQPVPKRTEQVPEEMTELGFVDGRIWMYLGQMMVDVGDRLEWNSMEFRVRSSRPHYIGETLLYCWALLEMAKEAAE